MIENMYIEWTKLITKYFDDLSYVDVLWNDIEKSYSSKNRYYHNLTHINSMLEKAEQNKRQISYLDETKFAIWFHDIIYNSISKKNEEKSANFARTVLNVSTKQKVDIQRVYDLIISTKAHKIVIPENHDNAFLLDFDLSILGSDWNIYQSYIHSIRKEYKIYPDFLYNPARKKVLLAFLTRGNLFFTEKYKDLFEEKARKNLEKEIKILS